MHPYPPVQDTGSVLEAVPVAAGGRGEPRPHQAGALGCVQRHRAADPGRAAPGQTRGRPIGRLGPADQPRRGRRADDRDRPRGRVHRRARERRRRSPRQQQSDSHVQLAEIAACDPDVKALLYFPLIDDTSLSGGFQSGNLFADLVARSAPTRGEGEDRGREGPLPGRCRRDPAGVERTRPRCSARRRSSAARHCPARGRRATAPSGLWTSFTVGRGRELHRTDRQGPGRPGRRVAHRDREGVLPARPALREAAAPGRHLPAPDRPRRADEPGPHDHPHLPDLHGRTAWLVRRPPGTRGTPPRHCHGHGRHGCGRVTPALDKANSCSLVVANTCSFGSFSSSGIAVLVWSAVARSSQAHGAKQVVTVRPYDTLWSIAAAATTAATSATRSGGSSGRITCAGADVRVGQKLVLP